MSRAKRKRVAQRAWKRRARQNPNALAIFARRPRGPLMHFDGFKFTNNGRPKPFATLARASSRARALMKRYPVLREKDYHVWVDPYPKA